jgi:hypothetical protein
MSMKFSGSLLFRAIGLSLGLNSIMMVTGVLADGVKSLSWLGWISTVIAAPPGLIVRLVMHLGGQSVQVYVAEAIGAFLCSIIFYTVFAWLALLLIARRGSQQVKES